MLLFLLWLTGWSTLPLSRRLWKNVLPDTGLAAGRVLLLCAWALLAFWLGSFGVPVRVSALLIYPVLALGIFAAWRARDELRSALRARRRALFISEALFFGAFAFFLILRGFWPAAADGEKPMDMALISSLARAEYLPPANPFAAGLRLNSYYYLGHLQAALLTDAVFSTPRWTYNLLCAALPALTFPALFALCAALGGRLRTGVLAALLVLCCGTLEPLRLWFPHVFGAPLDPRPYFATSRVIPFTVNEYPFFTLSFGDLHAHAFALPILVLVMSLAWALWRRGASTRLVVASAVTLAALLATNSWNLPLAALLIMLALGRSRVMRKNALAIAALCALALVFSFPFWRHLRSGAATLHLVGKPALDPLPWLLVWGLIVGTWSVVFFACFKRRNKSREYSFLCCLALCGVLALLWSELFWSGFLPPPFERQDTVFKFGLQAWVFLGTAAVCGILRYREQSHPAHLPSPGPSQREGRKYSSPLAKASRQRMPISQREGRKYSSPFGGGPVRAVLHIASILLLPIALYSSLLVVEGRARNFHRFAGFDAWRHLAPPERRAAQWLVERARDGDALFEAEKSDGGDYTEYARYAHATGVPAVIGPQAHSFQWIGDWGEVFARKYAAHALYSFHDAVLRSAILRKYPARWIVIGELERREYGKDNCARLERALPVAMRFGAANDPHRVAICHNPLRTF